ncbi:MAG: efflux RND transporter periplasmic adaptor subunit [Actinomycetota bacterium]|nr:efflux RND transporter periplasmic adaptor subunit [Actinomycetota bacterium]
MFGSRKKIFSLIVSLIVILVITVTSFSCMGAGPFSNQEDTGTNQGIETFEVRRGDIYQIVSTTGKIDSETINTYTIPVSGEILFTLEKGDYFKNGDILVKIDNSDGLAQFEKAERNLKISESSLRTAKINYQKAMDANHIAIQMADLNTEITKESTESALHSLENANEIGEKSSISQAQSAYDKAILNESTTYWNNLSNLQSADAQMESATENLNQAEIQTSLARTDYEEAQKNLDDYILKAPYDGMIISSDFKTGNQNSGGSIISMISDNFLIKTTIGETDILKVTEGDVAYIVLDAYPDRQFSGEVEKIIPIAVEEGNIVSFEISIKFGDLEGTELYYGLSADADIVAEKAENVLYVPIQSVYQENENNYVDVLISQQKVDSEDITQAVKKVEVTTGINDYSYIEITSGLTEGDIIVTSRIQ